MKSYTFPFETCEKVRDCIAQPYSAFMNLMSCLRKLARQTRQIHILLGVPGETLPSCLKKNYKANKTNSRLAQGFPGERPALSENARQAWRSGFWCRASTRPL